MSELTLHENKTFDLTPTSLKEAIQYSEMIANSNIVPKDFRGKPGDIMIAIQMGNELGLKPLQSLQNIAVINGRPTMWGDSVIALVRQSQHCEWVKETFDVKTMTATCIAKRAGQDAETRTFSMADATVAGLASKQGPWKQYPKRMLQLRARAYAVRDVFADVISGLAMREEVQDYNTPRPVERVINPAGSNTSGIDGLLSRLAPETADVAHDDTHDDTHDDLQQAIDAIDHAATLDQLKAGAGPLCAALDEHDQAEARKAFKNKVRILKE
jgi:hypothetical protein